MTQSVMHLLGSLIALTTIILAALIFRSEAQLRLESRHATGSQKPHPPALTAALLDHTRIQRHGERLIYFDPEASASALKDALKTAPLNVHNWSRYSVALFYAGDFEAANTAVQRTLRLAPTDAAIGMEQALLAADFWDHATDITHALWWENIEHLMTQDPLGLAQYAASTDRAERLCNIAVDASSLAALCARRK